jgi:hypothetical protein
MDCVVWMQDATGALYMPPVVPLNGRLRGGPTRGPHLRPAAFLLTPSKSRTEPELGVPPPEEPGGGPDRAGRPDGPASTEAGLAKSQCHGGSGRQVPGIGVVPVSGGGTAACAGQSRSRIFSVDKSG